MKPDWEHAPAGRDWLVMDADGRWNWFRLEPQWTDPEELHWQLHDDDWHLPVPAGRSRPSRKLAPKTKERRP